MFFLFANFIYSLSKIEEKNEKWILRVKTFLPISFDFEKKMKIRFTFFRSFQCKCNFWKWEKMTWKHQNTKTVC